MVLNHLYLGIDIFHNVVEMTISGVDVEETRRRVDVEETRRGRGDA